jgi:hypothetical protein
MEKTQKEMRFLQEMFTWEFQRLPLIHNTPADDWDVDRIGAENASVFGRCQLIDC